jgi:hypothetical protein
MIKLKSRNGLLQFRAKSESLGTTMHFYLFVQKKALTL